MDDASARAVAASEDRLSVAFRTDARVRTKTGFEAYLASLQKQGRVKEADLYPLPHQAYLFAVTSFKRRTPCGTAR
ncbi:hypothetical protein [Paracoccus spongiarum]|uniref:Uncharacterized protein n=1 Tax=Paracoccus spongiarum TaxID=3064387 RepID=A0ABT9JDS4_9RHOB|nr:hypothetical protein [Paracoccus sp. 2205BS29-5]MDP5307976.1 hypothetical protein [Paracoccus sp. 2205BS29-5]